MGGGRFIATGCALARALALAALAALAALSAGTAPGSAQAQSKAPGPGPGDPAILQADEVVYDSTARVIMARGNVEIAHGARILLGDTVRYDLDDRVVSAQEVTLLEPDGEVVFAESVKLSDDLRAGSIRSFRMLLADRSRLAAASAVRVEGNRTIMNKVVFSPCRQCIHQPDGPPLWQIKAQKVTHDQDAKLITYEDAWMEFFGVPVLYTPIFEHPDPSVARKTGFLTPSFGGSGELGARVDIPYYWAISPQRDLLVTPILTTEEGPALSTEYRMHTEGGKLRIEGSAAVTDRTESDGSETQDAFRGHVDADGQFNIDRTWRWGFRANRASDDTFLRVFDFDDDRFLESNAFVEGLAGDDYASLRGLGFQGQREADGGGTLPFILPEAQVALRGDRGALLGGQSFFDGSALGLTRTGGRDMRRLSATLGWERSLGDRLGGITDLTLAAHNDLFLTNGLAPGSDRVDPAPGDAQGNDTAVRVFPQLAVGYRMPLTRQSGLGQEILEPRVQVVAGPNSPNDSDIPNEDSRDFTFDDTNLFSLNRFPGRDRISAGQRLDYGVSYAVHGAGGGYASAFLGQSFRLNGDDAIPELTGGDGGLSDIVGRAQLQPLEELDLLYRFRFDESGFEARRNEVELRAGPPKLNVLLDYTFLSADEAEVTDFDQDREELFGRVSTRFARRWSAFASHRRDLTNSDPLETAFGIAYHCDCFLFEIQAKRTFFEDRDVDPDRSILFRIGFKHLGAFAE